MSFLLRFLLFFPFYHHLCPSRSGGLEPSTKRVCANNMGISMACAIREAYAAAVTVVILVDDEQDGREE